MIEINRKKINKLENIKFLNTSFWQSQVRAKNLIKTKSVEKVFFVEIEDKKVLVEKRQVSLWEFWLFCLWLSPETIDEKLVKEIKNLSKKEKALFAQIEDIDYKRNFENLEVWKYYKKFIFSHTNIIDLKQDEESILAKMKTKWRYNIKLAKKKWVEVKSVEKTKENIEVFYKLMKETTSRDNFSWNNLDYYESFLESDINKLFLAYKDDEVIAGGIFTFFENTCIYYYWASSSDKKYRNLMAPYLIQWEAIKQAKSLWMDIFDFFWIANPKDKNDPLIWVTDFKLKLSQNKIWVSKSYLYINKKVKYSLINLLKKIKKAL